MYVHTVYIRTAKALASLCICAGQTEHSLPENSTITTSSCVHSCICLFYKELYVFLYVCLNALIWIKAKFLESLGICAGLTEHSLLKYMIISKISCIY